MADEQKIILTDVRTRSGFVGVDSKPSWSWIVGFCVFIAALLAATVGLQKLTGNATNPMGSLDDAAEYPGLESTLERIRKETPIPQEIVGGSLQQARVQRALVAWLGFVFAYGLLSVSALIFAIFLMHRFAGFLRRRSPERPPRLLCVLPWFAGFVLAAGMLGSFMSCSWLAFNTEAMVKMMMQSLGLPLSLESILVWHNCFRDGVLLVLVVYCWQLLVKFKRDEGRGSARVSLYQEPHLTLLSMQFRRAGHLLYMGSLMLVVGMFQVIFWINLTIEYESTIAGGVGGDIARVSLETFMLPVGLFLSALLLSGYAIGMVSLTGEVKLALDGFSLDYEQRQATMKRLGLSDSVLLGYTRITALLGPTIVGSLGTYILRALQA